MPWEQSTGALSSFFFLLTRLHGPGFHGSHCRRLWDTKTKKNHPDDVKPAAPTDAHSLRSTPSRQELMPAPCGSAETESVEAIHATNAPLRRRRVGTRAHALANLTIEVKNISRLCHAKPIVTVNGKFPGPTIHVREGDRVLVNVANHAKYNMFIHWYACILSIICYLQMLSLILR
ncbi:hypothetical protein Cgig2_025228 [Carnegiea gigantea]|uniref:Plastocyanin-like domain-containing protein n=1 Tax=Carnegiea gigantea TaxID=171969 RepID=A0A9Q1QNH0_9CARY|nr:hypothetical protein Cgig2_025228 [Carnegiea gigantea]